MKKLFWMLIFLGLLLLPACRTCKPQIIKEPVEVRIPVPVYPDKIELPAAPVYEVCDQERPADALACVARNVTTLRDYNARLMAEIEAYNAAVTP